MNADTLSDLVLAVMCAAIAGRNWRMRPALAQACALLGLAAGFGVLRFAGLEQAIGPHRFFSLFAACAGFPLLAAAIAWPDDPVARRAPAATRTMLLTGAIGLTISSTGFIWWRQIVPVLSILAILRATMLDRSTNGIFGALLMTGSLVMAAIGQASPVALGPLTTMQWMHYLMASGLWFMSRSELLRVDGAPQT